MRFRLIVAMVAACMLSVMSGCEDTTSEAKSNQAKPSEANPSKTESDQAKPSWSMTAEKLAELKKMPRAERDKWFAELELPQYNIKRTGGAIKLDGVLDEPGWKNAMRMSLVDITLGGKPNLGTVCRAIWDDEALYVAYECDDPDVHNPLMKHDDPLWEHDLGELFIDSNCDSSSYIELHLGASGTMGDVYWANFRPNADWFGDRLWEVFKASPGCYTAKGVTSAVKVNGTLNNPDDTDKGYVLEWRIPFAALVEMVPDEQKENKKVDIAALKTTPIVVPKVGTKWRMNFVRCDDSMKLKEKNKKGKMVDIAEYTAWTPTTGSCHVPFLFGRVTFVD